MADHRRNRPATDRTDGKGGVGLQSLFERRMLRGLAAEWDNAWWMLPEFLRPNIRRPIFAIREMRCRLGSWNPANREIGLSRDFVLNHRWDDIRDVLLHEMAHQVAHEGLKGLTETDHGNSFRQACGMLRANPKASGAYRSLRARLSEGAALDDEDRLAIKIRKLMALAESSNPNEAHAAMRKAHELIGRHNVDLIARGSRQTYASIFLGEPRLRHFRESYHLAHLLQDFYFVQGVWVQAWVLEKERMGRVLEISGTAKNIQIAEYVHSCIGRYIRSAWAAYREEKGLNRSHQTDFAVGIIAGFRSTLQQASVGNPEAGGSHLPARIEDRALTRYLTQRYPHMRSFSRRGPVHDRHVLEDGKERGKGLIIAKGISQHAGFMDRVLEYHGASIAANADPWSRSGGNP